MNPDRTRRTFDPFRILSRTEREQHLAGYLRFLQGRDGEPDLATFELPQREAFFRDLEAKPVRWSGDVDEASFHQHLRDESTPDLDPHMVLLVSAAIANRGESYGVLIELDHIRTHLDRAAQDRLYLHLMLQETYHMRILAEICRTCGVEPVRNLRPSAFERAMIHAMMYLPDRIRWVAIFAGEILGTSVFQILRDKAHLFGAEPEVEARLRMLLNEIWTDEVGHVAYLRARIGPIGIRIVRRLVPLFTRALMRVVPQREKIGLTHAEIMERLRDGIEVPPAMQWIAPEPAAS